MVVAADIVNRPPMDRLEVRVVVLVPVNVKLFQVIPLVLSVVFAPIFNVLPVVVIVPLK